MPSDVYQITANGEPLAAQRCDGREHSASYVHLIITGRTEFVVEAPADQGQWSLAPECAVADSNAAGDSLCFTLEQPAKLILRRGRELLLIFADAPERDPPDPEDADVISILDRGVDASGRELITGKIQAAIDELAARPAGGVLLFPPGLYRTGTIRIKSRVTVYLSPGSRLQGSDDPADYPCDAGTSETPDRTEDIRSRLIIFDGVEDAALMGLGEIDGAGHTLRGKHRRVPNLIRIRRSRNIHIEGVILRRAAGWNTHVFHSDSVTIRNVKILSNWSDGIDVDNSRNVVVEDVLSASYDDAFAIKATWFDGTAERVGDIALRRSLLWTTKAAVKIGTETRSQVMKDITIEDVHIAGAREALAIRGRDGALIHDVAYHGITIEGARHLVVLELAKRHGMSTIEDLVFSEIAASSALPSELRGLDDEHGIRRVEFVGLTLGGQAIRTPADGDFALGQYTSEITFE